MSSDSHEETGSNTNRDANGDARLSPFAVISDVHSNVTALRAVLSDISSRGIRNIVCLGDVIGYGPDPVECWRLVSRLCVIIVRGNHDQALMERNLERFHPRAATAIEWTRRRLAQEPDGEHIIESIANLPRGAGETEHLFVHGSPAGPTMTYLLPGDANDKQRMEREFRHVPLYAFNGHTHIPGVIVQGMQFMRPEVLQGGRFELMGRKAIINVGSVGQPRDGNPFSSYVTVEGGSVYFHRVDYDAESVCQRILATDSLDPFLGQRLLSGY